MIENFDDQNGFCMADCMDKINEVIDAINGLQEAFESVHSYLKYNDLNKIPADLYAEDAHSDTEIPNTAYITLTEDGCFVGDKPTTQYNGEDIYRPYLCVAYFKEARDIIREEYGYELLELHCLQSSTEGKYTKTGNPIPDKDGTYAWVRAVYKNKEGKVVSSLWAFDGGDGSAANCASNCTYYCGRNFRDYEALRAGLFGSVAP